MLPRHGRSSRAGEADAEVTNLARPRIPTLASVAHPG